MSLRAFTRIVSLAFVISLYASPALSFDCGSNPPESWFLHSDIAFSGRGLKKSLINVGDLSTFFYVTELSVDNTYKGDIGNTVTVGTPHVSYGPGVVFLCGEEYMVYASKTSGHDGAYSDFWTTVCTPTRPLERGVPDTETLEEATYFDSSDITREEKDKYWEWMGRCLSEVKVTAEEYCAGDKKCLQYFTPVEQDDPVTK